MSLVAFLATLIAGAIRAARWALRRGDGSGATRTEFALRWLGWLTALCALAFATAVRIVALGERVIRTGLGLPPLVVAIFSAPLLIAALAVGLATGCGVAWQRRYWSLVERIGYTALAAASLVFVALLSYWNTLGPHF